MTSSPLRKDPNRSRYITETSASKPQYKKSDNSDTERSYSE